MLQPVVRRTWAPRGRTPIQYSWDRHDRLSVLSAISVSPVRRRLGVYFQIHRDNIRAQQVVPFVRLLQRHLGRPFLLVLDRYSVHRKAVRLLRETCPGWFDVEWLASYAPELNPVEQIWNRTKYCDLANFIPDYIDDLGQALTTSIRETRGNQNLIRSFFEYARLKL